MYFEEYLKEVADGLSGTIITNGGGNILSVDDGMRLWCEHVKQIRDEFHGMIFFCGNGASATMAEHMSHDWFQNAMVNTQTCSETAHLTAISNDVSFDEVFSYRIGRILSESDMLVTVSSSGRSANIINAIDTAKNNKAFVVTLSGMSAENASRKKGDLNFYVPLQTYGLVESAHAVILHAVLDLFLETYMGGRH